MRAALLALLLAGGCGAPRECSIEGRWSGVVATGRWEGTRVYLTFSPGGAYALEVGSAIFDGSWRTGVEGEESILTISDDGCSGGTVEGRYRVSFESDCSDVSIGIKQDPCDGRYQVLNGLVIRPSPQ